MKSIKKSCWAGLLFGSCLAAAAQPAQTACYNSYINCANGVDQSSTAAYASYQNTYNNNCNNYYDALTNGTAADWVSYNNYIANAVEVWSNGTAATTALYSGYATTLQNNYNAIVDPTCEDGVTLSYNLALNSGSEQYAWNNESVGLNYCPPTYGLPSYATGWIILNDMSGGLMNLNDIYNQECGTAAATLDRENTYENFEVGLQYDACGTTYANCMLGADCGENPPDCCADGCQEGYNSSMYGAEASYVGSVAGPDAAAVYAIDMAYVTQGFNDSEAGRNYTYAVDLANENYNYSMGVIGDLYTYRLLYDAAVAAETEGFCNCEGYDCSAEATSTQTAADASWTASYNAAAANLYNILTNSTTSAYNTYTSTTQSDANQEASTVTSEDNTINNIFNSAGNSYNNASNAASEAYQSCIDGCNGG